MMASLVIVVLAGSMLMAFIRLMRGPSLADRVVAFDLAAMAGTGLLIAFAVVYTEPAFLDVAMALAAITFIGTIAVAVHIEHKEPPS